VAPTLARRKALKHVSHEILSIAAVRKMPSDRQLLTIAAVVECLAGLALAPAPGATVALLVGAKPDSAGRMIGRVAGVALLALGTACWGARRDSGGAARLGTLRAITLYNAGVGFLLLTFAATGKAHGVLVWGAGVLHLGLAAGFGASLSSRRRSASDSA
jgi:hypothetical protein